MELIFDYSNRHCWPSKLGASLHTDWDKACPNPEQHPYKSGATTFIRWIQEFGVLAPGIVTAFPENEGWLKLGTDTMSNGDIQYCENYGGKVKAFLLVKEGMAIVEITDASLFEAAMKADEIVRASYGN